MLETLSTNSNIKVGLDKLLNEKLSYYYENVFLKGENIFEKEFPNNNDIQQLKMIGTFDYFIKTKSIKDSKEIDNVKAIAQVFHKDVKHPSKRKRKKNTNDNKKEDNPRENIHRITNRSTINETNHNDIENNDPYINESDDDANKALFDNKEDYNLFYQNNQDFECD